MNCERATALLLEADLGELEGRGDTDLVAHLERCTDCGERARRIVAAERALDRALDGLGRQSLARHGTAAARGGELPSDRHLAGAPSRRGWGGVRWAWIPLALAAGIAALILIPDEEAPPVRSTPAALDVAPDRLRVDVPAGRNAVLYETENPNVIVVWFY